MLERRRCHPLFIVEQLFRMVGIVLLAVLYSVIGGIEDGDVEVLLSGGYFTFVIIGALVLVAIFAFFSWLSWRNIWVSAEDNTLIYESGIISKKRVTVPFSKINTIDMGRNLFQRLFGTCRLKVDTGAINAGETSNTAMNIVFSLKDAEEFRSYILNRAAEDESELRKEGATAISRAGTAGEPRWAARARFSDFLLYGLTSSSVWKLFCSLLVVAAFIGEMSDFFIDMISDAVTPYAESAWDFLSGSGVVMLVIYFVIIFVVISLLANIWSIVYAAIRYYGFRVAREGGNVVVRYGLVSLKNYTVQAENVHAIIVKQNFLQQLIGRCSVEMVSIGYGNEDKETNLLFPIIHKKKLPWLIDTLLPEYSLSVECIKPEKRSVRFLVVRPIVWCALFLAAGVIGCSFIMDSVAAVSVAAVLLLAVVVVNSILRLRNNAIGCDGKVVLTRSGGMRVTTHYIRVDAVQSIASTSGIFQRPRKVASYRVDYHAPVLRNVAIVPHMNDDLLDKLDKYLLK